MNTNQTNSQVQAIDSTQLAKVSGGGPTSLLIKGAKKLGPAIADKVVDAAKWTGIPSAVGAGTAWVKHQLDKK